MLRRGPRIKLKLKQKGKLGQKITFFFYCYVCVRVKEERKRRAKGFFPRSTEIRRSKFIESKTKVHRIDEGYMWVPKMRDFSKDPNEEFSKSNVSSLRNVHEAF